MFGFTNSICNSCLLQPHARTSKKQINCQHKISSNVAAQPPKLRYALRCRGTTGSIANKKLVSDEVTIVLIKRFGRGRRKQIFRPPSHAMKAKDISSANPRHERATTCRRMHGATKDSLHNCCCCCYCCTRHVSHHITSQKETTHEGQPPNTSHFHPSNTQMISSNQGMYSRLHESIPINTNTIIYFDQCPTESLLRIM